LYINFGKRLFDIIISFVLLILLLPVFIVIGTIIWYDVGWPILFKQKRWGIRKKAFPMIKFRTIQGVINYDSLMSQDEIKKHTSVIGKWIRLHCCDEIPQLWNVLLGDMSIVGPRPLLRNHYENFSTPDRILDEILSVPPGITGAGQIAMCKQDYMENWIPEHDLHYVENMAWQNDVMIIIRTIPIIFRGH